MSAKVAARFPQVPKLGLGVGLDLPWGAAIGFAPGGPAQAARGDRVAARVQRFLSRHADRFRYLFISYQPKHRGVLDLADYAPAWDDLFAEAPTYRARALHQTTLNLAAVERYDHARVVDFTNALIDRYQFRWVNEDLGLWSLRGKPLPYPLPPLLTDAGLAACVRNVAAVQASLAAPLVVEFPGFSDGESLFVGRLHAYDFFRRVCEDTGSPATLDVGHLLSYQWLRGRRGEALYGELDRLPLDHCFEIHLSGCGISHDRFMDYHHGVLLAEQLELLTRLLPRCPALRAITYEDPKFSEDGALIAKAVPGFERLCALVDGWAS